MSPRSRRPASLSLARQPQRQKGRERFEHILLATEQLLETLLGTEITLAMIAERGGVPLTSVYHFFPNRNAVFIELARHYHDALGQLTHQPLTPLPTTWQNYLLARHAEGREYLNKHPAALRLFMGAGVSVEVRTLDLNGNTALAEVRAQQLRHHFDCRGLDDLAEWLAIAFGLIDGIWAISYANHGRISDYYLEESWHAAVAYLRRFMPETLKMKNFDQHQHNGMIFD